MNLTTARAIGGVLMGALGWFVSDLVRPLMPESTVFGWFNHVNLALGAYVGWSMLVPKGGQASSGNRMVAMSRGLTAAFSLATIGILAQSVNEMLRLSKRLRYSDPLKALEDVFRIIADFGVVLLHPTVIGPLIIGSVVIAFIVDMAHSRWR
ncbi:TrgA family protein [Phaeobacter sp. CNT1-3]|jgi:integral membrane sensor domain MASE1|nr:TrgA family protein [Phaeobacter sp. CNT1-3]